MSQIENVLQEHRKFPPPAAFQRDARLNSEETYQRMYAESLADPEGFWGRVAKELPWIQPWKQVLDWSQKPFAKWFVGGKLNASAVCLDQHVESLRGGRRAILWEGEPGDTRSLTYTELSVEVCRFANALKKLGLKKGDRVALYLPMIPEAVIAMLACARIGAAHSVVFAGFAANALRDRILDGGCTAVITADGSFRRGQLLDLKVQVDEALKECPDVRTVVVVRRAENEVAWQKGRDIWFHEAVSGCSDICPPEPMDSEDLLYLLYTSGSTGKPKGIVHTTGGYMVGAYLSTQFVFDLREEDIYWCTADIGWVTGHTYVVYGPLANCATIVMYEGAPNTPHQGRFWELVQKYRVSVFYTAPTAIRTFMRWGDEFPRKYDLSSLRLLGTVGEPINPEAWMWYREVIGASRCPIVDTWWQTETGSILITPLPGVTATKPGSATRPFFGVEPAIVDENGKELGTNEGGFLVIKRPWPSMLRGIWGDPARYVETYWKRFDGRWYVAGDGARRDEDGFYWILGRLDDVIKVSGHRLSTMEVESALVSHDAVVEAAVVGQPDDLTGQAICAFVTLGPEQEPTSELKAQLVEHVVREIGKLARPAEIHFTDALPKTRSGKIMRRLLRDIAEKVETVQDTTTLADYQVLARLRNHEE